MQLPILRQRAGRIALLGSVLVVGIPAASLGAAGIPHNPNDANSLNGWNRSAAAAYLDKRESWWIAWPPAARDHGTFCISCHTAMPYALSRPSLHAALAENGPSAGERTLLDNVTQRVRSWNEIQPYYGGQAKQSRGTEAVLNALILAGSGASTGTLSNDARTAFDQMWALQITAGDGTGAWPWIDFLNEPWEASDSPYYGATLAALAVGIAPQSYRATPEIGNHLTLLREYLAREYSRQSDLNRVFLLLAASKWPGLIDAARRDSMVSSLLSLQQPDGGWSSSSLAWSWRGTSLHSLVKMWTKSDARPWESKSDGLATGLVAYALQQSGLPRDNLRLRRGLAWLVRNQNQAEGQWQGYSLNAKRDPSSGVGQFMSDAATAFAVLALTSGN